MEYEYRNFKSFFLEHDSSEEDKRLYAAPRDRRSGAGDKENVKTTHWKRQKNEDFVRYQSSQKSIPSTPIHDPLAYQWTRAPRSLKADKGVQVSFRKKKTRGDINFMRMQLTVAFGLMAFALILGCVVVTAMNEYNRDLTTQNNQTQEKLKASQALLKERQASIQQLSEAQNNTAFQNSDWNIIEMAGSIDLVEIAINIWNAIKI